MRRLMMAAVVFAAAVGCESMEKHEHHTDTKQTGTKHEVIAMSALPPAVSTSFTKDHPGAAVKKVEKETYADGTVHYEVEFKDSAGKEHEIEYNADGEALDEH